MVIIIAVIIALIVTSALFMSSGFYIKALGKIPFYWLSVSAQTLAIIVTSDRKDGEMTEGGGNIIDLRHAIPGHYLDKSSLNPLKWEVREGEDPEHSGFFYRRLGVQPMGSIYYTIRTNVDRRLRFTRKKGADVYEVQPSDKTIRFIPFSGEMSIVIQESDTADALAVDMEFDFIFERVFPIRSIIRLADAPAFLTSLIEQMVNNATSILPAEAYLSGEDSGKLKDELAQAVQNRIKKVALRELGLKITRANLRSVSMLEKYRKILLERVEAKKAAGAALITARNNKKIAILTAEGKKQARILENDAEADHVQRVIRQVAEMPNGPAIRAFEAYENNEVVTDFTYAPGKEAIIPLGSSVLTK